MKKQRIAALAVIAAVAGCMDDGRLPTEPPAVRFSSHSAVQAVACNTGDLIAAIDAANQREETVLNLASSCVYRLTSTNNISPVTGINGLPVIRSTLTINGNGATIERLQGADFRLFYVLNAEGPDEPEQGRGTLTLTNATLRGGSYSNSGGALFNYGGTVALTNVTIENSHSGDDGGGVYNYLGTMSITNGIIRNNTASDHGGGLSNNLGTVTMRNTRVEDNTVSDNGGGVGNHYGTLIIAGNSRIQRNDAGDSGGLYNEGGAVLISDSHILNNIASDNGGGLQNVLNGTVTVINSVISGNHASDSGGGLSNSGLHMNVINSTIRSNHASDSGAGIANRDGGLLNIAFSTISGNNADEDGGAIYNAGGGVTITTSTLSGNTAKFGGGLSSESGDDLVDNGVDTDFGLVELINTTISGNSASEGGGGIYADKGTHLDVQFSTITKNTAVSKGGGGVLLYNDLDAETRFKGTIISGNSPHDVAGVERKSLACCSQGFNLIGRAGPYIDLNADFGQTGDLRNVTNARLGSLANNGGPTRTHALLPASSTSPASPAIDAGGTTGPTTDQRGLTRPSLLDIGAFEVVTTTGAAQTITFAQPASPRGLGVTFTVAPTASSGLPVTLAASGACSAVGFQVTMTSATGVCVLTASQSGSAAFATAPSVIRAVAAEKGAQTIVFTSTPPGAATSGGTYTPAATGGASGNPVTFGATGSCTYDAGTGVVSLAAGSCTVTANQAGDATYFAAPQAVQTFNVAAAAGIEFQSRSNGQNGGGATTLGVGRPAGVQTGDFLLAQITFEKGSDVQITAPGWTLVLRTNNSSDIGQAIYRRVATASEPSGYTWTFSQSVKAAGGVLRYTGVNTANPIVASSGGTGVSSSLTANSIAAEANGMLVAFYGFKKKEITLSVPAGMTGRYNFQNPDDLTIGAADERRSTWPATTGNRTSTAVQPGSTSAVTEKFVAQLVMLRKN